MSTVDSKKSSTIDRLDRQLIHALTVDPRAPFSRLAAVLGSSEQTVARRYRQLRERRLLRVRGLRGSVGQMQDWMVRARVRAGSAVPVAEALAAREDVSWLVIAAGGAEVVCATRPRTPEQRDALLLERLPGASQVTALSAHTLLHRYAGSGENEWTGLGDPLEPAQLAELLAARSPRPPGVLTDKRSAGAELEPRDEALAAVLYEDGRASLAALAEASGDTPARVGRRLEALLASAALYVDVELAIEALGFEAPAMLWISVAPQSLVEAAERLAAAPESAFVAAVSGSENLLASIVCRDTVALYEFLTEQVGALPGVRSVETVPIARRVKLAGSVMSGALLPEPV